MIAVHIAIAAALGGLVNRLRGGLFADLCKEIYLVTGWRAARWLSQQRTQTYRALYSIPTGLFAWHVVGGPWWLAVLLVASVFAGQAFFGNGGYLYDRQVRFPDLLGMARNFVSFAPAVFVGWHLPAAMVALGAFHAAMYWAAFRLGGDSRHGEVIVGAFTWGVIASFRI